MASRKSGHRNDFRDRHNGFWLPFRFYLFRERWDYITYIFDGCIIFFSPSSSNFCGILTWNWSLQCFLVIEHVQLLSSASSKPQKTVERPVELWLNRKNVPRIRFNKNSFKHWSSHRCALTARTKFEHIMLVNHNEMTWFCFGQHVFQLSKAWSETWLETYQCILVSTKLERGLL